MTGSALGNAEPARYSSKAMMLRRHRVLEATRQMLADEGYDGLTMRALAKRARVAPTTLFNIYNNKETLVATAVLDGFGPVVTESPDYKPRRLADLMRHQDWIASEIMRVPAYARAMTVLYFSDSIDSYVRDLLRDAASQPFEVFLTEAGARGSLADWADPKELAEAIANHLYTVAHDWVVGRIASEVVGNRLKSAAVLVLAGALTGPERAEADELLKTLNKASG